MANRVGARVFRVLLGALAVWCLGGDAFEAFVDGPNTRAAEVVGAIDSTQDARAECHCVQGHGATPMGLQITEAVGAERFDYVQTAIVPTPLVVAPPVPPPIG